MRLSESDIRDILSGSTFGAELEIANCDRSTVLPPGNTWCPKEGSVINRNRVGNDPKAEYNLRGGEIQVKPQDSEQALLRGILDILELTKCEPILDHENSFQIHIRIPNMLLDDNVEVLRHCLNYSNKWNPSLFPIISDLPSKKFIQGQHYHSAEQRAMYVRSYRDKYRSRQSILAKSSLERVNSPDIKTIEDLIQSMPPRQDGKPAWFILPRTAVNYRKMRKGDLGTIEFRTFGGSSDVDIIRNIVEFPKKYFEAALLDLDPRSVFEGLTFYRYPPWRVESNEETLRWLKTDFHKVERKVLIQNIKKMLEEKEITLGSLGYPEFWESQFHSKIYAELMKYSKDVEK